VESGLLSEEGHHLSPPPSPTSIAVDSPQQPREQHVPATTASQTRSEEPGLVFRAPSSYHPWTYILVALGPAACLLSMILVYYDGGSSSRKKKGDAYVCLLWTTVAILFLYAAVLPRRIELYSNATLVVSTWIFAFKFRNVTAAYEDPPFVEDFFRRPNLKFSSNFLKRVLVRRKNKSWDVLVSPKDRKGFLAAVWKVAAVVEEGNDL